MRVVVVLFLSVASVRAYAQTPTAPVLPDQPMPQVSTLQRYREQALEMRFSFWSGMRLQRNGTPVDLGFFAGNRHEVFAGSAAALDAVGTFRALRITGTVMWVIGMGMLAAELIMLAADQDIFLNRGGPGTSSIRPLFWGLFIPGLTVGLVGGMMMQGANGYLSDAVVRYNDDVARRLDRRGVRLVPSLRRVF